MTTTTEEEAREWRIQLEARETNRFLRSLDAACATGTKHRVVYRQTAAQPWQDREFDSRREAEAFKAQMRGRLWAAAVQWWHETDGMWIG